MKYYKRQFFFFVLMLALFLTVTQILYRLEKKADVTAIQQYFQGIIQDKNRRLTNLLAPEAEVFANYDFKLQVIESIYLEYIGHLRNLFRDKSNKSVLQSLILPFSASAGVFIIRHDRLYCQIGHDFNDLYGTGWQNRFTLALRYRYDDNYFSSAQTIIPYPVNFDQFAVFADGFQTIFMDGEFIHRYFFEQDNYSVLLLIRLGEINKPQIGAYVQQQFLTAYPFLTASDGDILQIADYEQKLSFSEYGLHYRVSSLSYVQFLQNHSFYVVIFLLVVAVLYYFGGYLVVTGRFEFRFTVLYFLAIWGVYLGFSWFFTAWLANKKMLLLQNAELEVTAYLKQLHENSFDDFMEQVAHFLQQEVLAKESFAGRLWHDDFIGLIYQGAGQFTFSSAELSSIQRNYLLHFCAEALFFVPRDGHLEERALLRYPLESDASLAEYKRILTEEGIEKNFSELPSFISQALFFSRQDRLVRPFVNMYYHFTKNYRGKFFISKVFNKSFYFYWQSKGQNDTFSLLSILIPGSSLFELYLQQLSTQIPIGLKNFIADNGSFYVFGAHRQKLVYTTEHFDYNLLSDIDNLWNTSGRQKNKIDRHLWQGRFIYYLFSEHERFSDFRYLFLFEPNKLFAPIKVFQQRFYYFTIIYFLFALLLVYYTLRRLLKPLQTLKQGFMQLEKGRISPLSVIYNDESGILLKRFNTMVLELERKKKMLPFVTDNLLELLGEGELARGQIFFSDQAIVVFSDIRSFTTISETYPPEEVVDMLNGYFSIWQKRVEKYGGIVERFVGDAIRVVFFARHQRNYAQNALQTCIEVMADLQTYNQSRRDKGEFEIRNGIGIAGGECGFVIIGGVQKMELMLLGEAASLSEDLETLSKKGRFSQILVSEFVYEQVRLCYDFADFPLDESAKALVKELII